MSSSQSWWWWWSTSYMLLLCCCCCCDYEIFRQLGQFFFRIIIIILIVFFFSLLFKSYYSIRQSYNINNNKSKSNQNVLRLIKLLAVAFYLLSLFMFIFSFTRDIIVSKWERQTIINNVLGTSSFDSVSKTLSETWDDCRSLFLIGTHGFFGYKCSNKLTRKLSWEIMTCFCNHHIFIFTIRKAS